MSKERFKSIVNAAVERSAFSYLLLEKNKFNKIKHIQYKSFGIQKYLTDNKLSIEHKKFLLQARGRVLRVKNNFRNMYTDIYCPLCSFQPVTFNPFESGGGVKTSPHRYTDDQQHLLMCEKLKGENELCDISNCYDDIFSEDLESQTKMTLILYSRYKKRRQLEDISSSQQIFVDSS